MSRHRLAIRLLEAAEEDLIDFITYVAADRPAAAQTIADRIEKSLELLRVNPRSGRVPREPDLAKLGYRYLVILDYLFFYKIHKDCVLVYRILHGARNYARLL